MSAPVVLVVDDTPANVRLLDAVLSPEGYAVVAAASGPEALAAAAERAPDVVLLDIRMADMNGYEVCRRLREAPATAMVPIVMITASGNEAKVQAIEAGADDFVLRPFDRAELLARIRSLLKVKRYRDTIEEQAAQLAAWGKTLEDQVAEQVAELDSLRLLRRFLPASLADTVLVGEHPGLLEPHRAEVAVVVCRLQGFDAISTMAQPEEALEALRGYHELLGGLVATHGATTGWIAGGGVQLIFGDPVPHPAPALAAVTLADDLRVAARPLVEHWARLGHALDVGAGVAFGHATLGTLGFDGRFDYGAVGQVVTDARRFADVAGEGEVLVGRRALAAVADRVEVGDDEVAVEGGNVARRVLAVRREAAPPASGHPIEVDVLGPLVVRHLGEPIELRAARERQVVAVLAAHHGQVVTVERLADEIWDGALAETAIAGLRVHVSRLRKTLGAAGIGAILQTEGSGYVLRLGDDRAIDATRFAEQAAEGRALLEAGDCDRAVTVLRDALALFRGPVLPDVPTMPSITALRLRLEEQRLVATEDRLDAELACGRHRDVLAELEGLLVAHPLRERFWGQRMLALHRSGRQPEALRAFQELRRVLAEATGLEPSPELRRLEQLVLEQSADLDLPAR